MKKIFFLFFILLSFHKLSAQHPFKYDSLYKKLYASEFCDFLKKHPDVQLIDVRTAGEFADTSQNARLNIGHLKGAINISSQALTKDIHLLDPYKEKTIVFYCSHSQRSRRISKLAAENGVTNFYTVNGGMSSLNELDAQEFPCKKQLIETGLPYTKLFSDAAAAFLKTNRNITVIDMRSHDEFESQDSIPANNVGRIKGAINLSLEELKKSLPESMKNTGKPVFIYSSSDADVAAEAARYLIQMGFLKVNVLAIEFGDLVAGQTDLSFMEKTPAYTIVDPVRALHLLEKEKNMTVYDIREDDEYGNNSKLSYLNLGRISSAKHYTPVSVREAESPADKASAILLYGNAAVYDVADALVKEGYKKVFVLSSFYDFVWSAFNVESCKNAKMFLVNHEGLY